jgi:hypothetical protein
MSTVIFWFCHNVFLLHLRISRFHGVSGDSMGLASSAAGKLAQREKA